MPHNTIRTQRDDHADGYCETGTDVCPDLVPEEFDQHRSFVVVPGVRRWLFEKPGMNDEFLHRVARGEFRRTSKGEQTNG